MSTKNEEDQYPKDKTRNPWTKTRQKQKNMDLTHDEKARGGAPGRLAPSAPRAATVVNSYV